MAPDAHGQLWNIDPAHDWRRTVLDDVPHSYGSDAQPRESVVPVACRSAGQRRVFTVTPGQPNKLTHLRTGRLTRCANRSSSRCSDLGGQAATRAATPSDGTGSRYTAADAKIQARPKGRTDLDELPPRSLSLNPRVRMSVVPSTRHNCSPGAGMVEAGGCPGSQRKTSSAMSSPGSWRPTRACMTATQTSSGGPGVTA